MLRTPVCDVLGIDVPIMQGPLGGPWEQGVALPAAVSTAGGLGTLPTTLRSPDQVRAEIAALRELTDRPFGVNVTRRPFVEDVFDAVLAARPKVISLALGEPAGLVERAHEIGAVFVQQVTTVAQAVRAAAAGVDVIIAQGTDAGGFSGEITTMVLVPQVADAVAPVPVLAAGGIVDGRGLAAALMLGAQGVNLGTRFLASAECGVADEWKAQIVAAASEDAVKVAFADHVFPAPTSGGYPTVPRSLKTDFVAKWNADPAGAVFAADELRSAFRTGTAHRLVPLTGQAAGAITEVLPAGEIVRSIVETAAALLASAPSLSGAKPPL